MSLPTVQKQQLPAHLQHLAQNTALMEVNQAAAHGIGSSGHARISIKGGRFRLQSPQGEEFVVPQLHLDVIVVGSGRALSKVFFAKKYDPNVEEVQPDCFSDNGIGASISARSPQNATCAVCPHNVLGSRISDAGSATKACGDYKKIAVLLADQSGGYVYELRLPYMSHQNWKVYIEALDKNGVPAAAVTTRLTFDSASTYPKLEFKPALAMDGGISFINEQQGADVAEVIGSAEVDECTGRNDRPIDPVEFGKRSAEAPAPAPVPLQNFRRNAGIVEAPATAGAPQTPAPAPAPPQAAASVPPAAARTMRGRRSKAESFTPAAPAQQNMEMPAFLGGQKLPPQNNAEVTAPLKPQGVTNAALDEAIEAAMRV